MTVTGERFASVQDTEAAQLKTLTTEDFQSCFGKWPERWPTGVGVKGIFSGGFMAMCLFL